jgi:hypothetical protein
MDYFDVPIPADFNPPQLTDELGVEGIYTYDDRLWIPDTITPAAAAKIIAAHVPIWPAPPTPAEKLEAAGLTVADLKSLLGLS